MKLFGSQGYKTANRGFKAIGSENCQTKWHKTANRGFYFGPSHYDPWSKDVGWKESIGRETKIATRFAPSSAKPRFDTEKSVLHAFKFSWYFPSDGKITMYAIAMRIRAIRLGFKLSRIAMSLFRTSS